MGTVYKQKGSPYWQIQWRDNGERKYENTKSLNKHVAERRLKEIEGQVVKGVSVIPMHRVPTWPEAVKNFKDAWATVQKRLTEHEFRLKHLNKFFRERKINTIGFTDLQEYVRHRLTGVPEEDVLSRNATIRKELVTFGSVMLVAQQRGELLTPIPKVIGELPVNDKREVPIPLEHYRRIREHLWPEDVRLACDLAYLWGWRIQSEILTLRMEQLGTDSLTIKQRERKTGNAKMVAVPQQFVERIRQQVARVRALSLKLHGREDAIPYLFVHGACSSENAERRHCGKRVAAVKEAWQRACKDAGFAGKFTPHDLKDSAISNMAEMGIEERLRMATCGHKSVDLNRAYTHDSMKTLQAVAAVLNTVQLDASGDSLVIKRAIATGDPRGNR